MTLTFAPLHAGMKRAGFSCGEPALDNYLATQARQDMKRGFATVITASDVAKPGTIIGYYTLSAASVLLDSLPGNLARKMPRYPAVPAIRLGRLAVDATRQKEHVGSLLVFDALRRASAYELAWAVFLVDAKTDQVATFYTKFLFQRFAHNPRALWMHRKQVEALVAMKGEL